MIFHEYRLPADDAREISSLIIIFFYEKATQFGIVVCRKLIGGALPWQIRHGHHVHSVHQMGRSSSMYTSCCPM